LHSLALAQDDKLVRDDFVINSCGKLRVSF
jgi:hypothetical protein